MRSEIRPQIVNTQNGSRNANFSTRAVRIILIYITAIPLLTFHPFSASLHWQTSLKRTNVSRRNSFHLIERGFSSFSVLGLLDLARIVQIQGLPHQGDKSNSSILAPNAHRSDGQTSQSRNIGNLIKYLVESA